MPSPPTTLQHHAFVYGSDGEFVENFVPFLRGGLEEEAATIAVTTAHNIEILREGLNGDASQVRFIDNAVWYGHATRTIAGYDRTVRSCLRDGAKSLRVIGEVAFGSTPREHDAWTAYEAIINRALADAPLWVACPYDSRALPDAVINSAWHTHPHMLGEEDQRNSRYTAPDELVRMFQPPPLPLPVLWSMPPVQDPGAFRHHLECEMVEAGVAIEPAEAMLVAANEVFVNAVEHGGGVRSLRVGYDTSRFVCEIADHNGRIEDPLAGFLPPPRDELPPGAGLWVARLLTTDLELLTGSEGGLVVRLWI